MQKIDTGERKVYIPGFIVQFLIDIKKEQDEVKEALGNPEMAALLKSWQRI